MPNARNVYQIIRNGFVLLITLFLGIFIGQNYFEQSQVIYDAMRMKPNELTVEQPALPPRFVAGEKLIYKIKSNAFSMGEAELYYGGIRQLDGVDYNYIRFTTKLPGVTDVETIYANMDFLPVRVERDIVKFGKKEKLVEIYDQSSYVLNVFDSSDMERPEATFKKNAPIQNAITLTYLYRNKPEYLTIGSKQPILLPKFDFDLLFDGEKKTTTGRGAENAFYFASEPQKFQFWLSKDYARIPLKIQQPGMLGYALIFDKIEHK